MINLENKDSKVVTIWLDEREVYILSNKHGVDFIESDMKGKGTC